MSDKNTQLATSPKIIMPSVEEGQHIVREEPQMQKQWKLRETEYFFQQMNNTLQEPSIFRYHLSAFLSAGRSVLQYVCEEAKGNKGGQEWYDKQMGSNPVLQFFRDARDENVHRLPANPPSNITIHAGSVRLSADGVQTQVPGAGATQDRPWFVISGRREDVMMYSERYVQELKAVVSEGIQRGFLSPD